MKALLSAIVTWLSVNFDLPANYAHPKLEFVPAAEIADRRYGTIHPSKRREVIALYDDATATIFLADTWTGRTPADLSVLVHEMVHHLQTTGNLTYKCSAAREKLAYRAQARWLGLFGTNLLREFEIDPMTLKVSTECMKR